MANIVQQVMGMSDDETNKVLESIIGRPKQELDDAVKKINAKIEAIQLIQPKDGVKGDKGDQGIQGPKGEPGRDGRDGFIGKDGKQGVDGKDGLDGKDGVSIVDVNVAFDNHLVITLSDGTEIDAGVIGSLNDNLQNVVANYVSNGANGTLIYKGLWNASTNTPTLSLSSNDAGAYYVVSVAGSTNLSGITDWQVNDWAIFNGTAWQKIDNSDLFNPSAVAITGGAIDGTTIGSTTASTGKFTSVTTPSVTATTNDLTLSAISTGVVNVNTLNGTGLRLSELAGGTVNTGFGIFSGTSSQNTVYTVPYGTFANSNMYLASKGNGNLFLGTNSNNSATPTTQAIISHTASAVNFVQVTGAATGNRPTITAQGSDANAGLSLFAKGTGGVFIGSNLGTTAAIVSTPTTGTNYFAVNGSATTIAPTISVAGGDTNISMAFQPKGTGAINLAAGSSGVNISNGGTVTAVTRTNGGANYTSNPTIAISAPTTAGGVQAVLAVNSGPNLPTIASGGTGYTVGDVITFVGGTFTTAYRMNVTSVSGGVITGISPNTFGSYTVFPASPVSVTGGTGSGATFTATNYSINIPTITNAGSGYIEQPTVTFSGGGGSGAAAYAHVGGQSIIRTLASPLSVFVPGGEAFRVSDGGATSAAYWNVFSGSTSPILRAIGSASGVIQTGSAVPIQFTTNASTSSTEQFRVAHTASAVNHVQVTGGATGNTPAISAQGSDANINLLLNPKGTGQLNVFINNGSQFRVSNTASAVNYIEAKGNTAGLAPSFSAQGTDTNIDLSLTTKGTGAVNLNTGNGTAFRASQAYLTGTAVNYFDASGRQTGLGPILSVNGSDADVRMNITAKGTGSIGFYTNLANTLQMQITPTASAVNYVQVTGAATGGFPVISAQGSDSVTGLNFSSKSTGRINFFNQGGISSRHVSIGGNGSIAVNYLDLNGNIASNAPSIAVAGTDTNIDLALTPKGTGLVRFGTYVAGALTATGYINIKAADGTTYKVLVST